MVDIGSHHERDSISEIILARDEAYLTWRALQALAACGYSDPAAALDRLWPDLRVARSTRSWTVIGT